MRKKGVTSPVQRCIMLRKDYTRRRTITASALLLLVATQASCSQPLPTFRYKLTLIVDTPEGRRTGSSVVEFQSHISPAFPGPEARGFRSHIMGEAAAVEIKPGVYVFSTFQWRCRYSQVEAMLMDSFSDQLPPEIKSGKYEEMITSIKARVRALARAKGVRAVRPKFYPMVVTFSDRSKLESLVPTVDTDIGKIYPGHKLVGMSVQIVDEPVTRRLAPILPWLKTSRIGSYDPACYADREDNSPKFGVDDFTRGT